MIQSEGKLRGDRFRCRMVPLSVLCFACCSKVYLDSLKLPLLQVLEKVWQTSKLGVALGAWLAAIEFDLSQLGELSTHRIVDAHSAD